MSDTTTPLTSADSTYADISHELTCLSERLYWGQTEECPLDAADLRAARPTISDEVLDGFDAVPQEVLDAVYAATLRSFGLDYARELISRSGKSASSLIMAQAFRARVKGDEETLAELRGVTRPKRVKVAPTAPVATAAEVNEATGAAAPAASEAPAKAETKAAK